LESLDQRLDRDGYAHSRVRRSVHPDLGRNGWNRVRDQQRHSVCDRSMKTIPSYWITITLALVSTAGSLRAALQFNLAPAVQSAAAGTQVTFSGTLTNTSATDNLFLNDI